MIKQCPDCGESLCPECGECHSSDHEAEQWRRAYDQAIADMATLLVALGFDVRVSSGVVHFPKVAEVLERIRHLQECETMGAQWCEALQTCAEILGVPPGASISTEVPHRLAELYDRSERRGMIILRLQSKR